MIAWWNGLSVLEHAFAYIAIPATVILVIQTILLLFGLGDQGDTDVDVPDGPDLDIDLNANGMELDLDGDGAPDALAAHELADAGLRIFTIRGFVAFFSVFGWCGLAMLRAGTHPLAAALVSFALGMGAMLALAYILKAALKLQSDGSLNLKNALGVCGSVYLTVPPQRSGRGKVTVVIQEQLGEFEAITDDASPLPTGSEVQVVGISGKSTLVVCRK